jgi:hypothetical protein
MDDLRRLRDADSGRDALADEATHQRLLKGFRSEEEAGHRRRLLFGDDRIEPSRTGRFRDD